MNGMQRARVVAVHPERRRLDLVLLSNGQRLPNVRVLGSSGSDTGSWDVPDVPRPAAEGTASDLPQGEQRALIAVVGWVDGAAAVFAFDHPPVTALAVNEQNRTVHRHPSGAYSTIAPDGSMEMRHPGGAYVRIGAGEHQPLDNIAGPGWAAKGGSPAQITVVTGAVKVVIEPGGAVTVEGTGELTLSYGHATLNGDVQLNGSLTVSGEVTANGVALSTHEHGGVRSGSENSGAPATSP